MPLPPIAFSYDHLSISVNRIPPAVAAAHSNYIQKMEMKKFLQFAELQE